MGAIQNAEEVRRFFETLAWPTVVMSAVVIFRKQLADLVGRITEVSKGDIAIRMVQAKAQKEVAELTEEIVEAKELPNDRLHEIEARIDLLNAVLRRSAQATGSGRSVSSWYERDVTRGILITLDGANVGESMKCVVVSPSGRRWDSLSGIHMGGTLAAAWPGSFPGATSHEPESGLWTWSWREEHGPARTRIVSEGGWVEG